MLRRSHKGYIAELLAAALFRAQTESRCCETLRLPVEEKLPAAPIFLVVIEILPGGALRYLNTSNRVKV